MALHEANQARSSHYPQWHCGPKLHLLATNNILHLLGKHSTTWPQRAHPHLSAACRVKIRTMCWIGDSSFSSKNVKASVSGNVSPGSAKFSAVSRHGCFGKPSCARFLASFNHISQIGLSGSSQSFFGICTKFVFWKVCVSNFPGNCAFVRLVPNLPSWQYEQSWNSSSFKKVSTSLTRWKKAMARLSASAEFPYSCRKLFGNLGRGKLSPKTVSRLCNLASCDFFSGTVADAGNSCRRASVNISFVSSVRLGNVRCMKS